MVSNGGQWVVTEIFQWTKIKKERERKRKNARNHDTIISMEFTFPNITGFNKSENQMALSMLDIIT